MPPTPPTLYVVASSIHCSGSNSSCSCGFALLCLYCASETDKGIVLRGTVCVSVLCIPLHFEMSRINLFVGSERRGRVIESGDILGVAWHRPKYVRTSYIRAFKDVVCKQGPGRCVCRTTGNKLISLISG